MSHGFAVGPVRMETCPPDPIQFHEYANLFPMLGAGAELDALREDIRANGVREPIVKIGNLILDGRHRYTLARDCLIEYPVVDYIGDDPLGFVISANLKRRHLTESQRSSVAAKLANMPRGGAYYRTANLQTDEAPVSQAQAAAMLNVSERSVASASKVLDQGVPALIAAVEAGTVAVSAAAEIAALHPDQQEDIIAVGPSEVREVARELREERRPNRTQFTGNNEWYTPVEYVEIVRAMFGGEIDLDPATSEIAQASVNASRYFTEEDDGLTHDWLGKVWLNPPYAQPAISHFADKMLGEVEKGNVTEAVMLTHNYTDTGWFQKLARAATAICFTRGRVRFVSPDGELAAPTQGQAFFYFGANLDGFVSHFADVGFVVEVRA